MYNVRNVVQSVLFIPEQASLLLVNTPIASVRVWRVMTEFSMINMLREYVQKKVFLLRVVALLFGKECLIVDLFFCPLQKMLQPCGVPPERPED